MKSSRKKAFHRPFWGLKALVDQKRLDLAPLPESRIRPQPRLTQQQEDDLFTRAMSDVTPLKHNRHWQLPRGPLTILSTMNREEEESVIALQQLIQTGQGFDVAQTDEYMEACAPGADPRITRRLHRGRYAIQDHIDLHGLFVHEAEPVLHRFIKQSIERGRHAVLIIHGRGLRSPYKPVLKGKVFEWLTRGSLKAHVVALASAKACDGGAGATYALLRQRPARKKH
jgi:DNA-nicking Smr family endonuclease